MEADEVVRSLSSLRMNIGSLSRRSWVSETVPEMWGAGAGHGGDVFERSTRVDDDNDEEELMWAAIERLPTFERLRKSIVKRVLEESGRFNYEEVDISNLGFQDKKKLLHAILRKVEVDNETFLRRIRERIDRLFYFIYYCLNSSTSYIIYHKIYCSSCNQQHKPIICLFVCLFFGFGTRHGH